MPVEFAHATGTHFSNFRSDLMNREIVHALVEDIEVGETVVAALRRLVNDEEMAMRDRLYLGRCIDLLEMELEALRQYVVGME